MLAPMQIYSLVCLAYFSKWNISISPNEYINIFPDGILVLLQMNIDISLNGILIAHFWWQSLLHHDGAIFYNVVSMMIGSVSMSWEDSDFIDFIANFKYSNGTFSLRQTSWRCLSFHCILVLQLCSSKELISFDERSFPKKIIFNSFVGILNHIWTDSDPSVSSFSAKPDPVFPWNEIFSSS